MVPRLTRCSTYVPMRAESQERKYAMSLTDHLIHATVRVACQSPAGQSSGTAFWFNFCKEEDGRCIPALVTNKHVVAGTVQNTFFLTTRDKATGEPVYGSHLPVTITDGEASWIMHPDPQVDLCICLMGNVLHQMEQAGNPPYHVSFTMDELASPELTSSLVSMEDIVMVGYPIGIWDDANNLPIIRRGVTATPFARDYQGRSEFMIDAACFPGSSGSPVCLLNQGSYAGRDGGLTIGNRFALLGVLYAGPQHTAAGEIIVENIPTAARPIPISRIPSNLGNCIKAEKLRDFEPMIRERLSAMAVA